MRVSRQGTSVLVVGLALLGSVAMPGAQALDAGGLDLASRVAFVAVDEVHRDAGGADAEVDVFVSDVFEGGASPFRRLTETDGADAVPFVWSPDGARLLVQAAFRFDPAGSVFAVDAFGGVQGRVAEAVDSFDWSADGSRVVLGRGDRIWSVSEDGSDVREVFQVPPLERLGETFPAERVVVDWAPAGDTVHVMAAGFGGDHHETVAVWFVDVGDGTVTRVDAAAEIAWRPDGAAFAYERDGWVVIAATSDPAGEVGRVSASGGLTSDRVWSGDSRRIAFMRAPVGYDGGGSLWVANADGSDERRVAELPGDEPRIGGWSPDRSRIAVTWAVPNDEPTGSESHLALIDVASGAVNELLRAVHLRATGWMEDGSAVVVDAEQALGRAGRDVVVVPVNGDDPWRLPNPSDDVRPENPYALGSAVAPVRFRDTVRVMGPDRVGTAVELSRTTFDTADSVVIARADLYPDALAGTPLAHQLAGPMLLTHGGQLDGRVASEIRRLGASHAVVLGTQAAVSDAVVADLREAGVAEVERIGGADRFATATMIADRLDAANVFVVEGVHPDPRRGWPDAVSVSALAAFTGQPILLTARDRLPQATQDWLADNRPTVATIVGGEVAVSPAVQQAVARHAGRTARISGVDRYEVSRRIADLSVEAGLAPSTILLVTGVNWPDALGAGVVAAQHGSLLLTIPTNGASGTASGQWLAANQAQVDTGVLVGGLAALSAHAQRDVAGLIAS